jgi:hypothetical protein
MVTGVESACCAVVFVVGAVHDTSRRIYRLAEKKEDRFI